MNNELNKITDEAAKSLREFYQEVLVENYAALTHYEAHFNLGLLAWRDGDIPACKSHLEQAAGLALDIIEARNPGDKETPRVPHSVALPCLVIFNFGTANHRYRLANLQRNQIIQPEQNEYKSLADLLDILRNYFADREALSFDKLDKLVAESELAFADKQYQPWVSAMARGLRAIAESNSVAAEKNLRYLLQYHAYLAHEEGWQKLAEGLMSLWALSLVNAAKKSHMDLSVKSNYLPV